MMSRMSKVFNRETRREKEKKAAEPSKVASTLADIERQLVEPPKFVPWVKSSKSDTIFGLVILMNAAFIGIDLELNDPNHVGINWPFWAVETIFLVIFLFELALRVQCEWPHPMRFFMTGWGAFDTSVTLLGCVDTWVFTLMAGGASGNPLGSLTVLRVFRLMRLVRLVRVLRMFNELIVLIQTLADSIKAVGWMSLLLGMILYTGSVVCVILLGQPYGETDEDIDTFYGTLPRALYSHFCVVTLENWPDISSAGMVYSPMWAIYWIFMIVLTNFSLVNLMVGVIVERIIHNAAEQDSALSTFLDEAEQFKSTLQTLFEAADVDASGDVTKEEVRQLLNKRETHQIMRTFGINLQIPPSNLYQLMDLKQTEGQTTFEEFYNRSMHLVSTCGNAHTHSMFVQHDVTRCYAQLCLQMEKMEAEVERRFRGLRASMTQQQGSAIGGGSTSSSHSGTQPQVVKQTVGKHRAQPPDSLVTQQQGLQPLVQRHPEHAETIQDLRKRMAHFEQGQMKLLSGLAELQKDLEEQHAKKQALIELEKVREEQEAAKLEQLRQLQQTRTNVDRDGSKPVTVVRDQNGKPIDSCSTTIKSFWQK